MNLVNGVECDRIDVSDRGIAYGDGVFRTLVLRRGKPVLWERQYAKLAADCTALRLSCPGAQTFESDLSVVAARHADCAVKITITRGSGARGYAIPEAVAPQRIVSTSPLPDYPRHYYEDGVRARVCDVRLALQPRLAGIKHLNRLENVLARSEWRDSGVAEGLMLDTEENLVCGTMSNLFLVKENAMLTPDLTRCGVAGATRELVIELARSHGIPVRITRLTMADARAADELFLVNSIIGVWQVATLEPNHWGRGALTAKIRNWLQDAQAR